MSKNLTRSNGYLDGEGSSAYGAHLDHTHALQPGTVTAEKVTLPVAGWASSAISVSVRTTSAIHYNFDPASAAAAETAGIAFTGIASGKASFTCTTTPSAAIVVYLYSLAT